ncbi:hypothetical protein FDP41_013165 [Naegleria fowleri]|uniref:NadR/Ttd14 AAA domain-containing protein n=1 Tax=Naegleria fowleri TaxID=5763 RepID=A0A6A5C1N9_NAEFO|nr:uncharacterized protein FDP41_013165 [Naegleria fowleri]KAF0980682.1 hypothetical protein FDP41_013165 [Naegleria fowleri]CAG4715457.1 unnamed protein product [Naegleria fowleri]
MKASLLRGHAASSLFFSLPKPSNLTMMMVASSHPNHPCLLKTNCHDDDSKYLKISEIQKRCFRTSFSSFSSSFSHNDNRNEFNNSSSSKFGIYCAVVGVATAVGVCAMMLKDYITQDNNDAEQQLIEHNANMSYDAIMEVLAEDPKGLSFYPSRDTPPIFRVVLTGGPCAGKTSAMQKLRERLQNLGFQVFIIPEAATLLMTGGAKVTDKSTVEEILAFETYIIKTQMAIEDNFRELAKVSKKPTILLCDRGTLDPKAYVSDDLWQALMDMNGWSIPQLRDQRYDCVIHLVTTAIGAEKYYTIENNTVRTETIEQARELDYKLRASYIGHPQLYIVDNAVNSFDEKLQKVFNILSHQLGFPRAKSSRRRFLLKPMQKVDIDLRHEIIDLEQIFLPTSNDKDIIRIVKRGQNGVFTYSYHSTTTTDDGFETISARPISARTYVNLASSADKSRIPISKKIYSFVYKNHYFELNHYLNGKGKGTFILSVEAVAGQEVTLPSFLSPYVLEEVTDSTYLSSYEFAKKDSSQNE